jgi:peptide deformylase
MAGIENPKRRIEGGSSRRHEIVTIHSPEAQSVLFQRAHEIEVVDSPETRRVVQQLLQTMDETGAMGFAAPPIGEPSRVLIFSSYPHVNHEDAPTIDREVVINPEVHLLGEPQKTWEKCYSVPGQRGFVPRYQRLVTSYTRLDGTRVEDRELEGFPAELFQHEYDHLEGCVYPLRVADRGQDIIPDEEYKRRFR